MEDVQLEQRMAGVTIGAVPMKQLNEMEWKVGEMKVRSGPRWWSSGGRCPGDTFCFRCVCPMRARVFWGHLGVSGHGPELSFSRTGFRAHGCALQR